MGPSASLHVLSRDTFDAVLFDLDGVVTATARVHAAAWTVLFDGYLHTLSARNGTPFRAFTPDDYRRYVDGRPRYEGVRVFLESRGISLRTGAPGDPAETETLCGLGNRKNLLFNHLVDEKGVDVYDSSVELIGDLRAHGFKLAVVTSSKNCVRVLAGAGLADAFDVRVDGVVAADEGLAGKPAPDTYLAAARRLGVAPARAVVIEDALSGVKAGAAGNFGLVVGVDRANEADTLKANGADIVVRDLAELEI